MYSDIPRWLSLTIYVLLSFKFLRKEKTAGGNADKEAVRKWLQLFITIFLVFPERQPGATHHSSPCHGMLVQFAGYFSTHL
jgi:hypothetical protein